MKKVTIVAKTENDYTGKVFVLASSKGLKPIRAVGTIDCRYMLMNGKGYTSILTMWKRA